jgi:hypothetical protein
MRILSVICVVLLLVSGCKTGNQSQTTQDGKYSEDLSSLRPKVEEETATTNPTPEKTKRDPKAYVEPVHTVNKQLDAVLDSIDRINLTRKFIEGYTIQVYSGLKREDALSAKKQLTTSIPKLDSELQYVQPNYRVKIGKYFTRLEAEKDYEKVKRYFPAAIVVPDKIAIN